MATYEGAYAAEYLASMSGIVGNVFAVFGEYSVTTSEASGDTIKIVKVPGGANVLPCYFYDSGSGGSYKIGTTTDDDAIAGSTSSSGWVAAQGVASVGTAGDDEYIILTVDTAPTSSATIKLVVFYTLSNIKE